MEDNDMTTDAPDRIEVVRVENGFALGELRSDQGWAKRWVAPGVFDLAALMVELYGTEEELERFLGATVGLRGQS